MCTDRFLCRPNRSTAAAAAMHTGQSISSLGKTQSMTSQRSHHSTIRLARGHNSISLQMSARQCRKFLLRVNFPVMKRIKPGQSGHVSFARAGQFNLIHSVQTTEFSRFNSNPSEVDSSQVKSSLILSPSQSQRPRSSLVLSSPVQSNPGQVQSSPFHGNPVQSKSTSKFSPVPTRSRSICRLTGYSVRNQ